MWAPNVRFGDILRPSPRPFTLGPTQDADLVGMRLYGEGPFHRERKPALRIAKKSHFVIRSGDVIFNKLFAWKGTFGIVPPELDGMFVSDKFPTYRADESRVDAGYLRWYFKYSPLWEQARQMSTGSAALSKLTLNPPKFLQLTIPLPPLEAQRRIVAQIEHAAHGIGEVRELRAQAKREAVAIIPAHLGALFGNPYTGSEGSMGAMTFRRMGDVSEDVADGPHITPTYVQDGIPFITVLNITSGRVRFGDHKHITPSDHAQFCKRAKAERGDVLISKDGTIGTPCFVDTDKEFSFFVSVALIKPTRSVLDGEFLTWVLRAPYMQDRIAQRARGDMIRHLVLREIRDLVVPVPPLEIQRSVVVALDAFQRKVETMITVQDETATELDALFPSILDRAFKGEL